MGKTESLTEYLARFKTAFEENHPETIDLDNFLIKIDEMITQLKEQHQSTAQLLLLKNDYQTRIAGMLKAIAVAKGNEDQMKMALTEIEQLEQLTASALIECYKKVQLRFRTTFPASFGQLVSSTSSAQPLEIKNYQ